MQAMIDSTYSERGWHWTGKIVEKSISCLTSIYFAEMSMLESERDSDGELITYDV
jgi:proteasome activator subunit 4